MTDLDELMELLDVYGFSYTIKDPLVPIPEDAVCNLLVEITVSTGGKINFYFKNAQFVIGVPAYPPYRTTLIYKDMEAMFEELVSKLGPDRKVTPGSKWKHFKGTIAEVITLCKHSETGEDLVVYKCSGNKGKTNHEDGIYARPLDMFLSEVDHEKYPEVKQKYRLVKISE